jgi:hypothetical protein
MLFSAILGSVFGMMGAVGGVLQFVEKKVYLYQRKAIRNEKYQNFLGLIAKFSKHGEVNSCLELPPHSPQLEPKDYPSNIELGGEYTPFKVGTEDLNEVVLEFGSVSELVSGTAE